MKKHELLKHAYDNYPKGTKFYQIVSGEEIVSSGKFQITLGDGCFGVCDVEKSHAVYSSPEKVWAEIVKPKIAVRVENEKEFKALMKYYDSLGYKDIYNVPAIECELEYFNNGELIKIFSFEDKFICPNNFAKNDEKYGLNNYQIIPFSEFSAEHGIKLPLLTSEDGVDLYEGCQFYTYFDEEVQVYGPHVLQRNSSVLITPKNRKAFSTKQAALDWIEAQKPKDVIISPDSGYPIIVYRKPVCGDEYIHLDMSRRGDYNGANIHLTIDELRQAVKAYDEMHS